VCADLAGVLSGWRWASDPPKPSLSREMAPEEVEEAEAQWWNFRGAITSARELSGAIPKMLKHWEGLRKWPETRDGYDAIEKLREALATATPYIELPFGPYEPAIGQKSPKPWHLPAVLIAGLLISALAKSTNRSQSLGKNSVIIRVVCKALNRMGHCEKKIDAGAVSKYVTRWREKNGELPNFNDHKASMRAL
jgi:hypothetical protein